jgi:hypothetical protein
MLTRLAAIPHHLAEDLAVQSVIHAIPNTMAKNKKVLVTRRSRKYSERWSETVCSALESAIFKQTKNAIAKVQHNKFLSAFILRREPPQQRDSRAFARVGCSVLENCCMT